MKAKRITKAEQARRAGISRMHLWRLERDAALEGTAAARGGRASASKVAQPAVGAAAALTRLEAAEAAAYGRLQLAIRKRDPLMVRLCREDWLKISESLRRYDLALEQSRRDNGELIPRSEVEAMLARLAIAWRIAVQSGNERLAAELAACETPAAMLALLNTVGTERILSTNATLTASFALPPWAVRALASGVAGELADAGREIERRADILRAYFAAAVETVGDTCKTIPPSNHGPPDAIASHQVDSEPRV